MRIPVYVVRKKNGGDPVVLSAWSDVYEAKYEASRWEQDSKIEHDYVSGVLEIGGEIEAKFAEVRRNENDQKPNQAV